MMSKRGTLCLETVLVCLGVAIGSTEVVAEQAENEKQEYQKEMVRLKSFEESLKPELPSSLEEYRKFADEIQKKWSLKKPEYGARLMLQICRTLSSIDFKDDQRHTRAREYALSVLAKSEGISLEIELELTGHVMTPMYIVGAPKGEEFSQRRRKDTEVRLHAWKRLVDSIDPHWDPNEVLLSPNAVAVEFGLPDGGVAPESVKDPKLRAEYEAATEENRKKAEKYNEQYRLHNWLKRFPRRAEGYIIQVYSAPPYNIEELSGLLGRYIRDEPTRTRMLDAVKKNMALASTSEDHKKQP